MRRLLYIVNPIAGKMKGSELLPFIKEKTKAAGIEYSIKISSRGGSVTDLAAKGVQDGYTEIIAVGGDGTITEVLMAVYEKNVVMGIIPAGTGNDFARAAGIPQDPMEALCCVLEGETCCMDVGLVNGIPFLNVVSMGIDGQIIRDYEKIKQHIKGDKAYLISTMKTIATFKPIKMKITVEGYSETKEVILVAVGNGQYFGGGMKITPNAELGDGLLDVCLVEAIPRWQLLRFFPMVFTGKHLSVKYVKYFKCLAIELESHKNEIDVNSDGNLIGQGKAHIEIAKSCQKFLISRKVNMKF